MYYEMKICCSIQVISQRSIFTVVWSSETTGICVGQPRDSSLVVHLTTETSLSTEEIFSANNNIIIQSVAVQHAWNNVSYVREFL